MNPIARVDPRACAAHGDCIDLAPHAFELNGDDVAVASGPATLEQLLAAAEACPSVAISVVDGDTGEQLYP
jgi:ferredoxin